jgi:calcineurin-like phosphoesterase family protein
MFKDEPEMLTQISAVRPQFWGSVLFLVILFSALAIFFLPHEPADAVDDPVIAAAGDIACDPASSSFGGGNGTTNNCRATYTSNLLVNTSLSAVLLLGDNQYYCGSYDATMLSYNLSWGRVKPITHPSVGNHEYLTSGGTGCTTANTGASGYFTYFGAAAGTPGRGFYSFDIGTWHLIALNTNCSSAGGCSPTSPQGQWLMADLATHPNQCTLAFWHIPLFSSGGRANGNSKPLWQLLYNYNADLILEAHDHIYERFAPQTPTGVADPVRGIRSFIVGTGGANHTSLATIAANSELRNTATYGVLKLTLHPTSYDWEFVPEAGKAFTDRGSGMCH